jgi:hypothetical protein
MMGDAQELTFRDSAGMTPLYLATEKGISEVPFFSSLFIPTLPQLIVQIEDELRKRTTRPDPQLRIEGVKSEHSEWAMEQLVQFGRTYLKNGLISFEIREDKEEELNNGAYKLTPQSFFWAAEFGLVSHIQKFVESGTKVDVQNSIVENGEHAIHYAAQTGQIETVEVLVGLGERVDATNLMHKQPLHFAAEAGQTRMVEKLIAMGAAVDCVNADGYQPIHLAAKEGCTETVEKLVALGASVHAPGGRTALQPIHLAVAAGHITTLKMLEKIGAKGWMLGMNMESNPYTLHFQATFLDRGSVMETILRFFRCFCS